jgi:hypothetical protein
MARQGKHARVRRRATDRRAILPAMPAKEIAPFLRSTPVFAGLPAPEIDSITSVVSEESHRARAYVVMEGDAAGTGNGQAAMALTPKPADWTSKKIQDESDGALFWNILLPHWHPREHRIHRWAARSVIRRPPQLGHHARPLQENGTRSSKSSAC